MPLYRIRLSVSRGLRKISLQKGRFGENVKETAIRLAHFGRYVQQKTLCGENIRISGRNRRLPSCKQGETCIPCGISILPVGADSHIRPLLKKFIPTTGGRSPRPRNRQNIFRNVRTIKKAPSGRELAPKAPEGERETKDVLQGREIHTVVALNLVVGIQNKI